MNGWTKLGEDADGNEVMARPLESGDVSQKAIDRVSSQTPRGFSPDDGEIGPVQRHSQSSGIWRKVDLRTFCLKSTELATTIKRFRDEMYRNQFPVLSPKFDVRCTECGTEFDRKLDECSVCGADDFETPSDKEKYRARAFFEEVNDDGQSLRALMEYEEDFQSFYGVSTIQVRYDYQETNRQVNVLGERVEQRKAWVSEDVQELVHVNPMAVVPVTDENGRHGGLWTCPEHRDEHWDKTEVEWDEHRERPVETCPECNAELEEVGYWDYKTEIPYLKTEIIDWARHFPMRNGLDGWSPAMPLLKLQMLLQFNREYDMAFLDPGNNDSLPNKVVVGYGKGISDSLSSSLQAEEDADPGEIAQMAYEGDPDNVEIDILDLTPQGALSGRDQMVKRLAQKIRAMFGVSDAIENELSDTGGMNAEGEQLEITNRAVASAQADTQDKALEKIQSVLGMDDWRIKYVDPKRERHELNLQQKISALEQARRGDIPYQVDDGVAILEDHEYNPREDEVEEEPEEQ